MNMIDMNSHLLSDITGAVSLVIACVGIAGTIASLIMLVISARQHNAARQKLHLAERIKQWLGGDE